MDWIIKIDNRLHEREVDTQHENRSANTSTAFNKNEGFLATGLSNGSKNSHSNTTITPTLPPGEPMEIDAIRTKKRQPLTETEQKRRHDNGLCMYCGGKGHAAASCPNISPEAKKAWTARQKAKAMSNDKAASGKA
ncbi:hypothetical protein PQX77_002679 [Marasmius sp. AFHP31]|nr:hypothetical protein PQX77_002679 [Marasmius sp. AFHP31]